MTEMEGNHLDPAIIHDYQSYIEALPPKERDNAKSMDNALYSEEGGGTGQVAIIIELAMSGTYWHHVLIYDKSHKRVRVMKYVAGHYMS